MSATTTERTYAAFTKTIHHDTYSAVTPVQNSLAGKVVLITGASRGIGRAIAIAYAQAGAAGLALGARTATGLQETAAAIAALPRGSTPAADVQLLDLDVTDASSASAAAAAVHARWGRLDIVVSNAGHFEGVSEIVHSDPAAWWRTWEVNVRGPYLVARALVPLLLATPGGAKTLVNISTVGALRVTPGMSAYVGSKFAGLRLVDALLAEHAGAGLLAHSVHPGGVPTAMSANLPESLAVRIIDTPELAAHTVVWLTRERREWLSARYVSATWDVGELEALRGEVEEGDLLKVRLAV